MKTLVGQANCSGHGVKVGDWQSSHDGSTVDQSIKIFEDEPFSESQSEASLARATERASCEYFFSSLHVCVGYYDEIKLLINFFLGTACSPNFSVSISLIIDNPSTNHLIGWNTSKSHRNNNKTYLLSLMKSTCSN